MSLLKNEDKINTIDQKSLFPLACQLFQTGAISEAYRLFSDLKTAQKDNPALLVNISLCLMQAEQWEMAISQLDQALMMMKKQPSEPDYNPDETARRLMELEQKNNSYLFPLPDSATRLAAEYTRIVIRRLLIDCCAAVGQTERVQLLAGALQSRHYKNVEQAKWENQQSKLE